MITWYLSDGRRLEAASRADNKITIYRPNGHILQCLKLTRCTALGYVRSYCMVNNVQVDKVLEDAKEVS